MASHQRSDVSLICNSTASYIGDNVCYRGRNPLSPATVATYIKLWYLVSVSSMQQKGC